MGGTDMKETYEELLARQEQERQEWEERNRRENLVTLQTSNYVGGVGQPFSIEMVFPASTRSSDTHRLCEDLHQKMGTWLEAFGYKFKWLPPKSEEDRKQEVERLNRLKKDLPQSTMAQLMDIIEWVKGVDDLSQWPARACRGFEKMHLVILAARGELHD